MIEYIHVCTQSVIPVKPINALTQVINYQYKCKFPISFSDDYHDYPFGLSGGGGSIGLAS